MFARSHSLAAVAASLFVIGGAGAAFAEGDARSGTFTGASQHETTGGVEVSTASETWEVVLQDDFTHDGAPDPHIGFGNDGEYDASTQLSKLRQNTGRQVYEVPEGIDPTAYNEVYIWCREYKVPLGVAELN